MDINYLLESCFERTFSCPNTEILRRSLKVRVSFMFILCTFLASTLLMLISFKSSGRSYSSGGALVGVVVSLMAWFHIVILVCMKMTSLISNRAVATEFTDEYCTKLLVSVSDPLDLSFKSVRRSGARPSPGHHIISYHIIAK